MNISKEELTWLNILNSLYLLRLKYPDEKFINKEVSAIALNIGENISNSSLVNGFVELAELPYVDAIDLKAKYQDHYQQELQASLIRLSELSELE
jgi:hypothetical protein